MMQARERDHVPLAPVTVAASDPEDAEPSSSSPGHVPGARPPSLR